MFRIRIHPNLLIIIFLITWLPGCGEEGEKPANGSVQEPGSHTKTIYVDDDGSDIHTGFDPDKPLKTITEALSRCKEPGMTIHVAPGHYNEGNGEKFPLVMKSELEIIGAGIDGVLPTRSIVEVSGLEQRIMQLPAGVHDILIEGLVFKGGNIPTGSGGAILLQGSIENVTIRKNLFSGNSAIGGGAIVITESVNVLVDENIFRENVSLDSDGGAMFIVDCSPHIFNNRFEYNDSAVGGGAIQILDNTKPFGDTFPVIESNDFKENIARWGGGVVAFQASPTIIHNRFESNIATDGGGGFFCWGINSKPYVEDNYFKSNFTDLNGGGILVTTNSEPTFFNNVFEGNITRQFGGACSALTNGHAILINCLFIDNHAELWGGAIAPFGARTTIVSCTVTGNHNPDATKYFDNSTPGVVATNGAKIDIKNSIIWEEEGLDLFINQKTGQSTINVSYTNTQEPKAGSKNISADPKFVPGPSGNYYLSHYSHEEGLSPCIDRGSTSAANAGLQSGWTTSSSHEEDTGILDLGYHYLIVKTDN